MQVSQVSDLLSLFFLLPLDVHFVPQFLNLIWFCEPKIRMVWSCFCICVFVDHLMTPGQLDSGRISCKVQNINRTDEMFQNFEKKRQLGHTKNFRSQKKNWASYPARLRTGQNAHNS